MISHFKARNEGNIVMSYIQNSMTLTERMKTKPASFSEDSVKRLFNTLQHVLNVLHNEKLYLTDIKPDNILVTEDNVFYVIDFGGTVEIPVGSKTAKCVTTACYLPDNYSTYNIFQVIVWWVGIVIHSAALGTSKPEYEIVCGCKRFRRQKGISGKLNKLLGKLLHPDKSKAMSFHKMLKYKL